MTIGQGLYGLPEPERPPRPPSRWRWPVRIVFTLLVLCGISIFTLRMIGGNGDSLKESLETYISKTTGHQARIETLNAVSFFPVLGVDFEGLTLNKDGAEKARFGHVNFSTGFLSATAGQPGLRTIDLQKTIIDPGVMTPQEIRVDNLTIDTTDPKSPVLVLDGQYGGKYVALRIDLQAKRGVFGGISFDLRDESRLAGKAGEIEIDAIAGTGSRGQRTLRIQSFKTSASMKPVTGNLELTRRIRDVGLKGEIRTGSSVIGFDLSVQDEGFLTVTGEIKAESLNLDDVYDADGLLDQYDALRAFYHGAALKEDEAKPYDFSQLHIDIEMEIKKLAKGSLELGQVSGPLKIQDGRLTVKPLIGAIKNGLLTGQMTLNATKIPARLEADIGIENIDYTSLSTLVKTAAEDRGRADFKMTLASEGNNSDELWGNLNGKAMIVAGEGELSSPLISLWGGGLLNAMLPSFDRGDSLMLNCGIGDFGIKGGIATASTFFLDTDDVIVVGDGIIDLRKSMVDMKLEPKSKDTAFLSAATAVHVEGPIEKPSISPDVFSLGKKLGGLFLGTINPAFLAFSLTDFGHSDKHPCQAYLRP